MNWYVFLLLCLGLLILAVAWLPPAVRRVPLSLPIICVAFGYALFSIPGTGVAPDPLDHPELTERLAELVVIVALMGAGLKLNRPVDWRSWMATWRLLAFTMPLSILGIALLAWWGLGLSVSVALLLGAVLAPTDPVLASDVQVGPPHDSEEDDIRFALTSEAGLNDGLAFPFVNLALALAVAMQEPPSAIWLIEWFAVDALWKLAAGLGIGLLCGEAIGRAFQQIDSVARAGDSETLVALGITLVSYGLAELVHGYGFLAVFVTALGLRRYERSHHYRTHLHTFSEQVERLFMMVLLVLFGGAVAGGLLAPLTWQAALFGLAALLLVRPLAGMAGLAGAGLTLHEKAVISFFGIRGVGSFYYLAFACNAANFGVYTEFLFAVVGFVVLVSVVLHGATSTAVINRYVRR